MSSSGEGLPGSTGRSDETSAGRLGKLDSSFPHLWRAQILSARPMILPSRQFVFPARAEEVERGALELLITPPAGKGEQFLATCVLGFASPEAITGLWSAPHPEWICAAAGGYVYLIDTAEPARWQQVSYRPVTAILPLPDDDLLIFAGFYTLLAWGREGVVWETGRLSWDGVRLTGVEGGILRGLGWNLATDRELEFTVDLKTGKHCGGGYISPTR